MAKVTKAADDNSLRCSIGFPFTPWIYIQNLRGYTGEDFWQPLFSGFAGFKNEKITIGGEITYKSNTDLNPGIMHGESQEPEV